MLANRIWQNCVSLKRKYKKRGLVRERWKTIVRHNHAPQQRAIGLAFHQQAADEFGGDHLSGAGEERLGRAGGCSVMGWVVAMGVDKEVGGC